MEKLISSRQIRTNLSIRFVSEILNPFVGAKGHSDDEIKDRAREISPARLVKGPAIPFLFIHGDSDPMVPLQQSEKMVEVLKTAGGSAELIVKKGGGHPWLTISEEVKIMADWFDHHLPEAKPEKPSVHQ